MTRNLKSALFSAVLVLLVAYPILGLKLDIVGVNLAVVGASTTTVLVIFAAALLMFLRVLFNEQISAMWRSRPQKQLVSDKASNFLTLPSTQRWFLGAIVIAALVWPFFGSRGAVDIATLILIYVMLGLGLNIVVGLAGLAVGSDEAEPGFGQRGVEDDGSAVGGLGVAVAALGAVHGGDAHVASGVLGVEAEGVFVGLAGVAHIDQSAPEEVVVVGVVGCLAEALGKGGLGLRAASHREEQVDEELVVGHVGGVGGLAPLGRGERLIEVAAARQLLGIGFRRTRGKRRPANGERRECYECELNGPPPHHDLSLSVPLWAAARVAVARARPRSRAPRGGPRCCSGPAPG